MTISVIKKDFYGQPTGELQCMWFEGKKLNKAIFHEDALVKAE